MLLVTRILASLLVLIAGAAPALAMAQSHSFSDSAISRAAQDLPAGEFRHFNAGLPPGVDSLGELMRGYRPDGSRAPAIDTWTDSGHWDPVRKRIFFQGLRQSNRFLSYDANANRWEELSLDTPNAPPHFERFGHLYGRTALDADRGHFYRLVSDTLHRYDIESASWQAFPDAALSGFISIDWHDALDMVVGALGREVFGFRDGHWHRLGQAAVHGYHSSAKYNPVRREMLLIGGNHSRSSVSLIDANGTIRDMGDAPFEYSIRSDNLTHDPVSGNYLVLHHSRTLWEYQPEGDVWRIALDMRGDDGGWPFARGGVVPIPIDELGIILWNQGNGAQLYRHISIVDDASGNTASPKAETAAPGLGAFRFAQSDPDSLIEREASSMEPGEWRNLSAKTSWPGKDEGVSFKSFQYLRTIDGDGGSGADGMGWTQNLVYHRGKLMMLLMRDHLERALMVMEADGTFWRSNQPEGFDQDSHRRPFNKLTQDETYLYYSPNIGRDRLGEMIRTPLDNPGVFEPFGIAIGDSQIVGQFAATYVPEWGRFYAYTPGGKIWSWAEGEMHWTQHGEMPRDENGHRLSGYAGLLLWNPVRKELVIVGGQNFGNSPNTSHKVYRLTEPLGAPEMLPDRLHPDGRPLRWNSGGSRLIVDPRDGTYLMLAGRTQLYRSDCAGGTFELYEDLSEPRPFGAYEPYAPVTHVPGTDVLVFLSHIRGLVLHRLQPARHASPPSCPSVKAAAPQSPEEKTTAPDRSEPEASSSSPPPPKAPRPDGHDGVTAEPAPAPTPQRPSDLSRTTRSEITRSGEANISTNTPRTSPAGSARELSPADIRVLRRRGTATE